MSEKTEKPLENGETRLVARWTERVNEYEETLQLRVVEGLPVELLLGTDSLKKLKAVLNYRTGQLHFGTDSEEGREEPVGITLVPIGPVVLNPPEAHEAAQPPGVTAVCCSGGEISSPGETLPSPDKTEGATESEPGETKRALPSDDECVSEPDALHEVPDWFKTILEETECL